MAVAAGLSEIDIAHRHLVAYANVVLPHSDPFDLLIVAQARADGLTLVTSDRKILQAVPDAVNATT
jgi:PIN domain nuclease of toxin-antitoxin system